QGDLLALRDRGEGDRTIAGAEGQIDHCRDSKSAFGGQTHEVLSWGVWGDRLSVRAAGPWTTRGWRSERSDNPWLIPSVLVDYARDPAIPSTLRCANAATPQSMPCVPLTPGGAASKPTLQKAVFGPGNAQFESTDAMNPSAAA